MKFANVNGQRTNASQVNSGTMGNDLWFKDYKVIACVGKYRQYWKYKDEKPPLPGGYESETEWHAAWKAAIIDEYCEVICGENNEHRADIKTPQYVIEIQKSPIDGRDVEDRINFYNRLTKNRVIWIVNVEVPWKKKRITTTKLEKDTAFLINWKYKWKWVEDISTNKNTHLYLDFNSQNNKLIKTWTFNNQLYGSWIMKEVFFKDYLSCVSKEPYKSKKEEFINVFKDLTI